MNKYKKPKLIKEEFLFKEDTASLNQWLIDNNLNEAGITTYVINS